MLLRLEGVYKPPRDLVRITDSDSAGLGWLVQPLRRRSSCWSTSLHFSAAKPQRTVLWLVGDEMLIRQSEQNVSFE